MGVYGGLLEQDFEVREDSDRKKVISGDVTTSHLGSKYMYFLTQSHALNESMISKY